MFMRNTLHVSISNEAMTFTANDGGSRQDSTIQLNIDKVILMLGMFGAYEKTGKMEMSAIWPVCIYVCTCSLLVFTYCC